jgi:hypothetical protein
MARLRVLGRGGQGERRRRQLEAGECRGRWTTHIQGRGRQRVERRPHGWHREGRQVG